MMDLKSAVKTCLITKFSTLRGRACRSEYWWWMLFYMLATGVLSAIDEAAGSAVWSIISTAIMLVLMVPHICVNTRRLHDIGKSGWWQLLPLGGFIAAGLLAITLRSGEGMGITVVFIILLAPFVWYYWWMCKRGDAETNAYGDPEIV
jgi:uncharacterized membrane protein YhaH (DUF805 family)